MIEGIAGEVSRANEAEVVKSLRSAFKDLRRKLKPDAPIPADSIGAVVRALPRLDKMLDEAVLSVRGLAVLSAYRQARQFLPAASEDAKAEGPFKEAMDWMRSRDIASIEDAREMAEAMAVLRPDVDVEELNRQVRREVIALANSAGVEATQQVREVIANSINVGETATDFLERMDVLLDEGQLPGATDGYLNMVYRTETSNGYHEQLKRELEGNAASDNFWGVEVFNPNDERSRPSHAAIDGLLLQKGSSAYQSLGVPPFSYQCRCTMVPIYVGDPADPGVEESDDADELVAAIERFD